VWYRPDVRLKVLAAAAFVALALASVVLAVIAPTNLGPKAPRPPELPEGRFVDLRPTSRSMPTSPEGFREIAIRPTREYDFASREQVLGPRSGYVRAESALFGAFGGVEYEPSQQVFGNVTSGRPWWGLVGLAFFGPGARSIEGDSAQSRYIENPYLLVGVEETWAHVVSTGTEAPHPVSPRALYLGFDDSGRRGWARFDVRAFFDEGARLDYPEAKERTVRLCAYNASDLGLRLLAFDADGSQNVERLTTGIIVDPEFIHVGSSCGYQGGCNNKSPSFGAYVISVPSLPARLAVKLWRASPSSAAAQPDVWFILEFV
jgi:hypothetical protein